MRQAGILGFLVVPLLLGGCARAPEGKVPLSDPVIEEALAYGSERSGETQRGFLAPWTVDLGYGQASGAVTYISPFLRVAILGKRGLSPGDRSAAELARKVLREDAGVVLFSYGIYCDTEEEGRKITAALEVGDRTVSPVSVTRLGSGEMSRDYFVLWRGEVRFPRTDVPADAEVTVVVSCPGGEGRDPYTLRFPFILSKYR